MKGSRESRQEMEQLENIDDQRCWRKKGDNLVQVDVQQSVVW